MVRVDVHAPVPSLHDPGDERLRMQRVVLPGKDLPDGASVAIGKPGHVSRMDVKFAEPLDIRKGTPQGIKDFVRLLIIARVMGRFMGGAPSRTHHSQDHIRRG